MKYWIIIVILLCGASTLFAHNPLSARYHLEAGEKVSLLTISLSQDGMNQALISTLGQETFYKLSYSELEKEVVKYIKEHFEMHVHGHTIKLVDGGIKLGSHQTDLKFVLPPLAGIADDLMVDIPAFKENGNHQTIFSHNLDLAKRQIILSKHNNYKTTFLGKRIKEKDRPCYAWLGLSSISLIGLGFLRYRGTM